MLFLIKLRQALISYQDYHMLSLTFSRRCSRLASGRRSVRAVAWPAPVGLHRGCSVSAAQSSGSAGFSSGAPLGRGHHAGALVASSWPESGKPGRQRTSLQPTSLHARPAPPRVPGRA